jgi:photosystem II stability/assembly factor-like uncharacterized protein
MKQQYRGLSLVVGIMSAALVAAYNWDILPFGKSFGRTSSSATRPADRKSVKIEVIENNLPHLYTFFDVSWLSKGRMLSAGYDGSDSNRLYTSADGGVTWRIESIDTAGWTINATHFIDNATGWIVGASGLVLFTSDGGYTWRKLARPTRYPLEYVNFVNSQVGYVAAGMETGGQVFRTADGGRSWRSVFEDTGLCNIFDLVALSENTVILAVNDDYLLRTEDGGLTWTQIETIDGASGFTLGAGNRVWLAGENGGLYYSGDQGKTWQRPSNLPQEVITQKWNSIAFADSKRGIIVGNKGAVAVTYDGGVSWKLTVIGTTENLGKVRFKDKTGLIIGAQNLFRVTFSD